MLVMNQMPVHMGDQPLLLFKINNRQPERRIDRPYPLAESY
jgi:hypothetical protein